MTTFPLCLLIKFSITIIAVYCSCFLVILLRMYFDHKGSFCMHAIQITPILFIKFSPHHAFKLYDNFAQLKFTYILYHSS
jgi:hypothetical protein